MENSRLFGAAKKLFLIKIVFEEVGFKRGVEDRDRRAVKEVDSEWKRIPDLCMREAESTTIMQFSFEGGDSKGAFIRRRTQIPRREADLDTFTQAVTGTSINFCNTYLSCS